MALGVLVLLKMTSSSQKQLNSDDLLACQFYPSMPNLLKLDIWGAQTRSWRPAPIIPWRFRPRICFLDCLSSVRKAYLHRWHPPFVDLDTQIHFFRKKVWVFCTWLTFLTVKFVLTSWWSILRLFIVDKVLFVPYCLAVERNLEFGRDQMAKRPIWRIW